MNIPKPIQFITIDKEGTCQLTEEAENMISQIDEHVAVICIAGIYRSGKSYLLNRLLGRQDGFEIGPTISSCTKGLWVWGEPINIQGQHTKVLVIDTEGLASAFADRNETIDMEIFCLGVLLSSLFIYNSMKNIDEAAIENLSLVLNFSKRIKSMFKDMDTYVNNFPSFLWVLRDFALELIDASGTKITATEYLENSLKVEDNILLSSSNATSMHSMNSEEFYKKNEIRKTLKLFFKERDCFTLIRPVNDEKKLRYIDKLPKDELRPEFLLQMEDLVKKVYAMVRPKEVQGSYMNGKMFINLVKIYINALNSNSIPDVKTSWKLVVEKQMEQAFDRSISYYVEEMIELDYKAILKVEDLMKSHHKYKEIAIDYLQELSSLNIPLCICLDYYKRLEHKISEQFMEFMGKWKDIANKRCLMLSDQIIDEYKNNPEQVNDIFSCPDLIEEVLKFIEEAEVNERKYEIIYPQIVAYFVSVLKKCIKDHKTKIDEEISTLKHDKTVLQGIIDTTKEMLDKSRDNYEKQIKDMKEEHMENRLDVNKYVQ